MSAIDRPLRLVRKTVLIIVSVVAICWGGFFIWRYTPVQVRPPGITKIVMVDAGNSGTWWCEHFQMTPETFSAYFAKTHRLSADEDDQYDYGACYYEATVGGKIYRIWQGGMAEVIDGGKTTLYADTAKKANMNP